MRIIINKVIFVLSVLTVVLLIILLIIMACRMFEWWQWYCYIDKLLGTETKKETITFIGLGIAGLIGLLALAINNQRAEAQEKTAEAQLKSAEAQKETAKVQLKSAEAQEKSAEAQKETAKVQLKSAEAQEKSAEAQLENSKAQHKNNKQKTFNDAIINLGNNSSSIRLGGIYSLYEMVKEFKEIRINILKILCAHLRDTTQDTTYQEKYRTKPSNEIQSLIEVLSQLNKEVLPEYEYENKDDSFYKNFLINFNNAYLVGVNFYEANFQKANFYKVNLQEANLQRANLQEAEFFDANLQEARFFYANFQKADLNKTDFQYVNSFKKPFNPLDLRIMFPYETIDSERKNKKEREAKNIETVDFTDAKNIDKAIGLPQWIIDKYKKKSI